MAFGGRRQRDHEELITPACKSFTLAPYGEFNLDLFFDLGHNCDGWIETEDACTSHRYWLIAYSCWFLVAYLRVFARARAMPVVLDDASLDEIFPKCTAVLLGRREC